MNNEEFDQYNADRYDFDRYNYVDREIYSTGNNGRHQTPNRRPRKKKRIFRKIVIVFIGLSLITAIIMLVYGAIISCRINRPAINTSQYIQQPSAAPTWNVISSDDVVNILLIGADQMEQGAQRSDSMMLFSFDKKTKTVHLVSFLRDLYLEIPTLGKDKLNASFSNGGAALTMQTLENNFRIKIDKYIMTDFNKFSAIIDKMGGIDLNMSQEEADYMNKIMHSNCVKGNNHLNGSLALYYSRMRYLDSDFGRTSRQRQVIETMLAKMKKQNVVELTKMMYDYAPLVTTNLSDPELLFLASVGHDLTNNTTKTLYIPYKGTYEDKNVDVGAVLVPDLEKNCAKLREFLYEDSGTATSSSVN
jgi:LCP family protein required for cell wall assembly